MRARGGRRGPSVELVARVVLGALALAASLLGPAPGARAELCGDLDASGSLSDADRERLRRILAALPPPPTFDEELLCDVADEGFGPLAPAGSALANGCTVLDVAFIARLLRMEPVPPGPSPCPLGSSGTCCAEHPGVGCEDAAITRCVCSRQPHCCEGSWDERCTEAIGEYGCGVCGTCGDGRCEIEAGESGANCPADCSNPSDCCTPDGIRTGCDDPAIEACVCAIDPECCTAGWDGFCVDHVTGGSCGTCPP